MKKLIVCVVLLFLLAGCGDKTNGGNTTVDNSPATTSQPSVMTSANTETEASPVIADNAEVEKISEDDFVISDLGDGTCQLDGCLSEATTIVVPETISGRTVVGIGSNAFATSKAEKIVLPDTVTYIDSLAFNTCKMLREVDLGRNLEWTGENIFNACPALESVSFPEGMTSMRYIAFSMCDNLKEVYIPASVTDIPHGIAFKQLCPNIIIVTPAGSVAEQKALEKGLTVRNS